MRGVESVYIVKDTYQTRTESGNPISFISSVVHADTVQLGVGPPEPCSGWGGRGTSYCKT